MKNRVYMLGLGAVWLLASSISAAAQAAAPAQAAPAPAPAPQEKVAGATKVAVVNIQRAISDCAEGKKAGEDLAKRFAPKRDELERKGAELQQLQKKLQDGEKLMSDEQKTALMKEIDRKTKDFNRDNEDAQADYQSALDAIVNPIGSRMLQVIGVYSQKNGYDLVLNLSNAGEVLWHAGRVEITDEVIGAFNMTFNSSTGMTPPPTAPASTPRANPPVTKPSTPPATPKKP